jgi:hypothetical protein
MGNLKGEQMSQRNIVILIVGLLIGGLLTVGCGGGGDSESTDTSIDKATFVKRANVICEKTSGRMTAETKALSQKEFETPSNQSIIRIISQVAVPGLESELKEIQALGLPSEEMQQIQAFLRSLQKAIAVARAKPFVFANGESPPYEAAELASRRIGLSACPVATISAS